MVITLSYGNTTLKVDDAENILKAIFMDKDLLFKLWKYNPIENLESAVSYYCNPQIIFEWKVLSFTLPDYLFKELYDNLLYNRDDYLATLRTHVADRLVPDESLLPWEVQEKAEEIPWT